MSIAFLDFAASYNFIALPQLKQFAPNSKDWRWAKPLQVKLSDKSSVISSHISILFMYFAPGTTLVAVEFRVVPKLSHLVIFGMSWSTEFNPQIDWHNHSVQLDLDAEKYTLMLHVLLIYVLSLNFILLTSLVNC